ncbi:MAG: hypothetical protein WDM92_05915 [Caulobacteraceae bacterium]
MNARYLMGLGTGGVIATAAADAPKAASGGASPTCGAQLRDAAAGMSQPVTLPMFLTLLVAALVITAVVEVALHALLWRRAKARG